MALAHDQGTGFGNSTVSAGGSNGALATAGANEIILVCIHTEVLGTVGAYPNVTALSGASLTWHLRKKFQWRGGRDSNYNTIELWYALAPTAVSSSRLDITWDRTIDDASVIIESFSGVDMTNPFDVNASLTATGQNTFSQASPTDATTQLIQKTGVSTNANDTVVFAFAAAANNSMASNAQSGTGYTSVNAVLNSGGSDWSSSRFEYKINSAPQSGVTVGFVDSTAQWGIIVDAIVASGEGVDAGAASSDAALSSEIAREKASDAAASSDHRLAGEASSSDHNVALPETWNPSDKSASLVLSNGNYTASINAQSFQGTRAYIGQSSGHRYFEIFIPATDQTTQFSVYGVAPASQAFDSSLINGNSNSPGVLQIGESGGGGHFSMTNVTVRVAVDFVTRQVAFAIESDSGSIGWFGGNRTIATGVQYPIAVLDAALSSISATINLGDSPFRFSIPKGYESWDGLQGADSFAESIFNAFLIFGTNSTSTSPNAALAWSSDGDNFTFATTPVRANGSAINYNAIAYAPLLRRYVALSNNADSASRASVISTDGKTWTANTLPIVQQWNAVDWSPSLGLFVAVSGNGTNRAMWSADGKTWTLVASADDSKTWNSVRWCDFLGMFVAVGNNAIGVSTDGKTWTAKTSPVPRNWRSVIFAEGFDSSGTIVAVADNSGTSPDGFMYSTDGNVFNDIGQGTYTNQAICYSPDRNEIVGSTASGGEPAMVMGSDLVAHYQTNFFNVALNGLTWSRKVQAYYIGGAGGKLFRATDPTGAWESLTNPVADGAAIVSVYEADLRFETPSSQLASDLELQSDDQAWQEASSSDKPAKDAASSDRVMHSDSAAADAASSDHLVAEQASSSDKPAKDAASSDHLIAEQASSSDKPVNDALSSDHLIAEQASSSDHLLFEQASSSARLAGEQSSSDALAGREAGSSSNAIESNEIASSAAQDVIRGEIPPPIQVVVTIGS